MPYTIKEIHDLYDALRTHKLATGGQFTEALRLIATVFAERDARLKQEMSELEEANAQHDEEERELEKALIDLKNRLLTAEAENAKLQDRLTPRPIETAPIDGSWYMTYYSDGCQVINRVMQGSRTVKYTGKSGKGACPRIGCRFSPVRWN